MGELAIDLEVNFPGLVGGVFEVDDAEVFVIGSEGIVEAAQVSGGVNGHLDGGGFGEVEVEGIDAVRHRVQ